MTEVIDFTNCKLSDRDLNYGGRAGEKRGIIYNGSYWFLKFPKNTLGMSRVGTLSYVTSPISEYIGSHIYEILGYDVHKTLLGICFDGKRNKVVCACKDFIEDEAKEVLIPYTALRNDTNKMIMERNDTSFTSASNIDEIVFQLDHNTILSHIPNAKERFWDVVVIDLLINNNDRNEDNWGVIKNRLTNSYSLAPIYDCGNCFYGKSSEEKIASLLQDEPRLKSSSTNGITAYTLDTNDDRIALSHILEYENDDLKKSIKRVYELVSTKMDEIEHFINEIPEYYQDLLIISNNRKEYYIKTFKMRYEFLLKKAYNSLKS